MDSNKTSVPAPAGGAASPGPATEQGGIVVGEWWSRIRTIDIDFKCREIPIDSWSVGDLRHMWAVTLRRPDEPTVEDIIKAARGAWTYRILHMSLYVERPPVDMHMTVAPHRALYAIKREYLYPTDLMPRFRETAFENSFTATLDHYFAWISIPTLPGDKVFIDINGKYQFRGTLRMLNC